MLELAGCGTDEVKNVDVLWTLYEHGSHSVHVTRKHIFCCEPGIWRVQIQAAEMAASRSLSKL